MYFVVPKGRTLVLISPGLNHLHHHHKPTEQQVQECTGTAGTGSRTGTAGTGSAGLSEIRIGPHIT